MAEDASAPAISTRAARRGTLPSVNGVRVHLRDVVTL
jgi:hypothetical protein